jgi:hypothetical protein
LARETAAQFYALEAGKNGTIHYLHSKVAVNDEGLFRKTTQLREVSGANAGVEIATIDAAKMDEAYATTQLADDSFVILGDLYGDSKISIVKRTGGVPQISYATGGDKLARHPAADTQGGYYASRLAIIQGIKGGLMHAVSARATLQSLTQVEYNPNGYVGYDYGLTSNASIAVEVTPGPTPGLREVTLPVPVLLHR